MIKSPLQSVPYNSGQNRGACEVFFKEVHVISGLLCEESQRAHCFSRCSCIYARALIACHLRLLLDILGPYRERVAYGITEQVGKAKAFTEWL